VKLLAAFVRCYDDEQATVRAEACVAASRLRIRDQQVIDKLSNIIRDDAIHRVKALAIQGSSSCTCCCCCSSYCSSCFRCLRIHEEQVVDKLSSIIRDDVIQRVKALGIKVVVVVVVVVVIVVVFVLITVFVVVVV